VQIGVAEKDQALAKVGLREELVHQPLGFPAHVIIEDGEQQLLLGFEIAVERRLRAADALRDERHRGAVIAKLLEGLAGNLDDLASLVLGPHTHPAITPRRSIPYMTVRL
jgi:hypothetical protein